MAVLGFFPSHGCKCRVNEGLQLYQVILSKLEMGKEIKGICKGVALMTDHGVNQS